MSTDKYNPATDPFMLDLYKQEAVAHSKALTDGVLGLERSNDITKTSEELMRAAHSIKGAARMVGFDVVVDLAHAMEDCFVAAQNSTIIIDESHTDILLKSIDTILDLSEGRSENINDELISSLINSIRKIATGTFNAQEDKVNNDIPASNVDNGMLELFRADALEQYSKIIVHIDSIASSTPTNAELSEIQPLIQTIASGAKLSGQNNIFDLCTAIDTCLLHYIKNDTEISVDIFNEVKNLLLVLHSWLLQEDTDVSKLSESIARISPNVTTTAEPVKQTQTSSASPAKNTADDSIDKNKKADFSIQISTRRMNRLVGLASENVVESRWVRAHADSMLIYKRRQTELISALDSLRSYLDEASVPDHITAILSELQHRANDSRSYLSSRLSELDDFDRRITGLSERLNHEVLQTRMRPFSDCTHGYERMLRDIARKMGKRVELTINGGNTQVDREILNRIEAPLNHILRNAVDHGIETTDERRNIGKEETAKINITASHNMGMLSIAITDDGQGVNIESLRNRIVERNLVSSDMALSLSDNELLDFLYLPGFSTRSDVTEISGRGVGLDVVHNTIQEMRGQIRTSSTSGKGMRIQLMLPLTLSVIRSLLVSIGGQPYAIPLARIDSIHTLEKDEIETIDGNQFFMLNDRHIGLVDATQVLQSQTSTKNHDDLPIVVLGDRNTRYGLVIDEFMGERDLAVHILDPRLGKLRDISAATLLENGSPALIIDVDDMIRSIELLISGERLNAIKSNEVEDVVSSAKSILVVDDSITVREVERKLLESRGYNVDVAVDGMDGWNTVQNNNYDLVISDIDMPRMNGIEFVTMMKNDDAYKSLPVMIVSYKDRQEDREAGLQAGADYYLTKGSFHDESLIDAVIDLIGDP